MNLFTIFLLFSKIFFTESLISFLFESWRRSAAACHKQTSPLCHYAWVRGASLPILLFAFSYASFIFILLFAFQILHLQYAFLRFCILYFAFYILRFAFASWPHDTSTTPPFDCLMIYIIWYKPPLSSGKKYIVQFIRILPNASDNLSSPLGGSQPAAESDKW